MSVVWCKLDFSDTGTFTVGGVATFKTKYKVYSNNPFDTVRSIQRSQKCPQVGKLDPQNSEAYVTSVTPTRFGNHKQYWTLDVQSTTEYNPTSNPLDLPANIVTISQQSNETVYRDREKNWIRNKAGTIIPVDKKASFWVFQVTKNLPNLPEYMMEMNNKINSGFVYLNQLGIKKRRLMVTGMKGTPKTAELDFGTLEYTSVSFQLLYNRRGWNVQYPNADLVELKSRQVPVFETTRDGERVHSRDSNNQPVFETKENVRTAILDEDGKPRTSPWPLDEQGAALPTNYSQDQIVMLEAEVYDEASFTLLPLS